MLWSGVEKEIGLSENQNAVINAATILSWLNYGGLLLDWRHIKNF
jgi:hypothetical protein